MSGLISRALVVQFQNVRGNDVEQFKDPKVEVVLYPARAEERQPDLPLFGRERSLIAPRFVLNSTS